MGRYKGPYTNNNGTLMQEERQYSGIRQTANSPIVDVILNTASDAHSLNFRRMVQTMFGPVVNSFGQVRIQEFDASVGGGGSANNFIVVGGESSIQGQGTESTYLDGSITGGETEGKVFNFTYPADTGNHQPTGGIFGGSVRPEGVGRMIVGGLMVSLPGSRSYKDLTATTPPIHSVSSSIGANTLTDTSAFWGKETATAVNTGNLLDSPEALGVIADWILLKDDVVTNFITATNSDTPPYATSAVSEQVTLTSGLTPNVYKIKQTIDISKVTPGIAHNLSVYGRILAASTDITDPVKVSMDFSSSAPIEVDLANDDSWYRINTDLVPTGSSFEVEFEVTPAASSSLIIELGGFMLRQGTGVASFTSDTDLTVTDSPVGRILYPDLSNSGDDAGDPLGFPILSTSSDGNTLTVDVNVPYNFGGTTYSGGSPAFQTLEDANIVEGNQYLLSMTTPTTAQRVDTVIIDVYEDEVDPIEDPVLNRVVEGAFTTGGNLLRIRQRIEVLEGIDLTQTLADAPNYKTAIPYYYMRRVDSDGNTHHRAILATLIRPLNTADIFDAQIKQYNADRQSNMTMAALPNPGSDSSIKAHAGGVVYTEGADFIPGSWGGQTLKVRRLPLQALANVTDKQNKAFQNMGIYLDSAGVPQQTEPGTGLGSTTGSIPLLSASELGGLKFAYAGSTLATDAQPLAPDNALLSVRAHNWGATTAANSPFLGSSRTITDRIATHAVSVGLQTGSKSYPHNTIYRIGDLDGGVDGLDKGGLFAAAFQYDDTTIVGAGVFGGIFPENDQDVSIKFRDIRIAGGITSRAALSSIYNITVGYSLATATHQNRVGESQGFQNAGMWINTAQMISGTYEWDVVDESLGGLTVDDVVDPKGFSNRLRITIPVTHLGLHPDYAHVITAWAFLIAK